MMPGQALQRSFRFLCFGFQAIETVADGVEVFDGAALDFGECGLLCGLYASLCTLRMYSSVPASLYGRRPEPPPHAQNSVRVAGTAILDGNLHLARSADLLGASRIEPLRCNVRDSYIIAVRPKLCVLLRYQKQKIDIAYILSLLAGFLAFVHR